MPCKNDSSRHEVTCLPGHIGGLQEIKLIRCAKHSLVSHNCFTRPDAPRSQLVMDLSVQQSDDRNYETYVDATGLF